ncbi:hypothetical protein [Pseudomonas fontis]|uniref:Lipoprotein n=1 Tax=Pseudomonas fontis TaxID=2942633 RepID=A0ABT5NSZ8_9PSED|nr:hypothetical protein [Pseudomonas fontis]MDD0975155.1 hypothetical protein [Pseudomonas fontis]MDD0991303.1 hypothetical protein [Pseudomonas fontis]
MSLQVLWGLFASHPAKLINLLALLFTCPGGMLLHSARRRAAVALSAGRSEETMVGGWVGRVSQFYYVLGFAMLAMALLLSWFSTWI